MTDLTVVILCTSASPWWLLEWDVCPTADWSHSCFILVNWWCLLNLYSPGKLGAQSKGSHYAPCAGQPVKFYQLQYHREPLHANICLNVKSFESHQNQETQFDERSSDLDLNSPVFKTEWTECRLERVLQIVSRTLILLHKWPSGVRYSVWLLCILITS